ncbi:hypothetical protein [Vulcanisaeta souniana]|uniref:Uncharacterized protein n=1 Tax=Vulcanisaeta souniana JCM 11219 TaxID=1293586 RepID=A0A830EKJ9_9CREN|nr:hypothetical protein [Vulcanisaeta souniana]BDR91073.1 hypothetical protein Vsou_01660 [Vulcanisaeta souniana JCM 11219]GGI80596.1 hypothetical protein GCM10007112_16770 [Vulcanisaeta souniana JCM 11219]
MVGSRHVVALDDFIIIAPISRGQARTLLSLLRVLYYDYLDSYRDYRGVIINLSKLLRGLALRIVKEFNIKCTEGGAFHEPCLIIYDIPLDIPPMVFRINDNYSFEDILHEVLRRGFIDVTGDLHVDVTYVYRKGGRLRIGGDYFKAVVEGSNIYIEHKDPDEEEYE